MLCLPVADLHCCWSSSQLAPGSLLPLREGLIACVPLSFLGLESQGGLERCLLIWLHVLLASGRDCPSRRGCGGSANRQVLADGVWGLSSRSSSATASPGQTLHPEGAAAVGASGSKESIIPCWINRWFLVRRLNR